MNQPHKQPSRSANPTLKELEVLVGEWKLEGSHPLLIGPVRGRAVFAWFEGGAFLSWKTEFELPDVPNAVSSIGCDDVGETCTILYSDIRGVSRIYEMRLKDGEWKMWRNAPGFMQRMTGTISTDRNTITVRGELSRDGLHWEQDLDLVYTRVRQLPQGPSL
jgi:hypothetical protein